jgi:uncharacterized protein YjbI with pentapeptide repeats
MSNRSVLEPTNDPYPLPDSPQPVLQWANSQEKKRWVKLQWLIMPSALALVIVYLQDMAKQRDFQIVEAHRQIDQKIANDRAKQETLNRYFDQISTLLIDQKARSTTDQDQVQLLARVRTLLAMRTLDAQGNQQLSQFLQDVQVLAKTDPLIRLESADLAGTTLNGVHLQGSDLRKANLTGADLGGADLRETDLREATLTGANLETAYLNRADLAGASLEKADLHRARLVWARLLTASLQQANLSRTYLNQANLRGANLSGADLTEADLSGADLSGANLTGATLLSVHLDKTNLSGANLTGATLNSKLVGGYLCQTTMPDGLVSDRDCKKTSPHSQPPSARSQ